MPDENLDCRARDEADSDHGEARLDEPLLLAASHHCGDQQEDDRKWRKAERPVDELHEAQEERARGEEAGDGFGRLDAVAAGRRRGHGATLSRRARSTRAESRVPCGPPRRGRGPSGFFQGRHTEYSLGSTPGSGSALIAYQTTIPR